MIMARVKFYMNKYRNDGTYISGSSRDLEVSFDGLLYIKATGFMDKGKRKNIHTESYADSDTLRVWQGDEVTRDATKFKLTLLFTGDGRFETYKEFYEYVKNNRIKYFDTNRLLKVMLVLQDAVTVATDQWKGGTPYFQVEFTFQNLWGEAKAVTSDDYNPQTMELINE